MKSEYDFSKGVRGKFYRPNVKLELPIYLDDDVLEFIKNYANQKSVDIQILVNELLRQDIALLSRAS